MYGISLEKKLAVVDAEDAAVAYLAAFAGRKYLYVPPASVKIVSQGDTISELEYLIAVLYLAGAVGNKNRGKHKLLIGICRVRFYAEYII